MSGRGTAGGVSFQALVGAVVAGLLLSGRPLSRLSASLAGSPRRVLFETPDPVDDVRVETDMGVVYIQAKRTLTLSSSNESELRSVADQFVAQYRRGVELGGRKRTFDVTADRLVIAVSAGAAATVATNLRDALERNATGAATALPANLSGALTTWTEQLKAAWKTAAGAAAPPVDLTRLLQLSRVVVIGDAQEALVIEALRDVVQSGGETAAFDTLCRWSADSSGSGTGADGAGLRAYLQIRATLIVPPSFRQDIERLQAHSAATRARLSRFRSVAAPEGSVTLERAVTAEIISAGRIGSFLITGDPGAGKSACLHAAAEALAATGTLILLSVDTTATSLDALRASIGLENPLVEVLAALPGPRPCHLLIDALDAARGGLADVVYRRLLEDTATLEGWTVMASVRSFDLRMGRELRKVFTGAPPAAGYADPAFASVRHVHIPLLGPSELNQIGGQSPRLAAAIEAGGPGLRDLVRNPFNLGLLSELLAQGVAADALANVTTRGQLLERYWAERVDETGLSGLAALGATVDRMVSRRSTVLPAIQIPAEAATSVEALIGRGVLVRDAGDSIAFRHHVLFDYAVSRTLLAPDPDAAFARFSKKAAAGMLLAPALAFWLDLRRRTETPAAFWALACSLVTDEGIDPIIRSETARLIVEAIDTPDPMGALAMAVIGDATETYGKLLSHLVGALHAGSGPNSAIPTAVWARLADGLAPVGVTPVFPLNALLNLLLEQPDAIDFHDAMGRAARRLLELCLAGNESATRLARSIIPMVARTYASDPAKSRALLNALFEPGRFAVRGFIEVPALAQEIRSVAEADPDFAVQIYHRVFPDAKFSRDQTTAMGSSWILSLSSNAAQDFEMARYSLGEAYSGLLQASPLFGARALAATMAGHTAGTKLGTVYETATVSANGREYQCRLDRSALHTWRFESDHPESQAKVYQAFIKAVPTNPAILSATTVDAMLDEADASVVWFALFAATSTAPERAPDHIWPLATSESILTSQDLSRSAIGAVVSLYSHVSESQRRDFETAVLNWTFSDAEDPGIARDRFLARLFRALADRLLTADARALVPNDAQPSEEREIGRAYDIEPWNDGPHSWMRGDGLSISPNPELLAQVDALEALLVLDALTEETHETLLSSTNALFTAAEVARGHGLEDDVDRAAGDVVARSVRRLLRDETLAPEIKDRLYETLIALSHHPLPRTAAETESEYAASPFWSSPAPRVETAETIGEVLNTEGAWPGLSEATERLLQDRYPAVRTQIVSRLNALFRVANTDMWRLIHLVAEDEQNLSVLVHLGPVLSRLRTANAAETEAVVLRLLERFSDATKPESGLIYLLVHFGLIQGSAASGDILQAWVFDYEARASWLEAALGQMRDLFVRGYDDLDAVQTAVRERALAFVESVIAATEPAVTAWPARGGEPTSGEVAAVRLIDSCVEDIFFGTGAGGQAKELVFKSDAAAAAFLDRTAPILRRLGELGTPRAVHYILQILAPLVSVRPALSFDLIAAALLRTGGVARYEYESLGANLFVKLVGIFLADHRDLFESETRRRTLLECIAVFVDAGWPEARRLFHALPELLA